jgi:DNA-binding CsgD family transcriptional regulator
VVDVLELKQIELIDFFDHLRDGGADAVLWRRRCAQGLMSLFAVGEVVIADVISTGADPSLALITHELTGSTPPVLVEDVRTLVPPGQQAGSQQSKRPGEGAVILELERESPLATGNGKPAVKKELQVGRSINGNGNGTAERRLHPQLDGFIHNLYSGLDGRFASPLFVKKLVPLVTRGDQSGRALAMAAPSQCADNHCLVVACSVSDTVGDTQINGSVKIFGSLLVKIAQSIGSSLAPHNQPSLSILPNRQQNVLSLLLLGLSDQEISQKLMISHDAVRWHVKNIFRIFNVNTRSRLMARWIAYAQSRMGEHLRELPTIEKSKNQVAD